MDWYKTSQDIEKPLVDMTMDEIQRGHPSPDDFDNPEWARFREKRNEWQAEIQRAISEGRKTPDEADKQGLYITEKVKGLPKTLYHTTTAKDKVISNGLKTRDELNMEFGTGLGGGSSDTISFTESLETALFIRDSLLEMKKIADGRLTIPMMIEMAKKGVGAKSPWLNDTLSYWGSEYRESGDYPDWLKDHLLGIERKRVLLPEKEEVEGWTQDKDDRSLFFRKLTEERKLDNTVSFYKTWSFFRQYAGGPEDPLFFSSDVSSLGNISEDQIAVLEFRSKPGGTGYMMGSLGEWRVWSGNAVEFVRVVV